MPRNLYLDLLGSITRSWLREASGQDANDLADAHLELAAAVLARRGQAPGKTTRALVARLAELSAHPARKGAA